MAALDQVIRKLRRERHWTQGQLAAYSGVSKANIGMIEAGQRKTPTVRTMAKLAAALRVSVDHILIEAGFLPAAENPSHLSLQERELIEVIRSIPTQNIRSKTLDLAIGFATVARDADAARQEEQE